MHLEYPIPAAESLAATITRFVASGIVTSIFSSSLAMLAQNAGLREVLCVGMVVPSFTWVVQICASAGLMHRADRSLYWNELGRVCLLGSIALLPAAIVNLCLPQAPLWVSAANVLASVAIMGVTLFRRSTRLDIAPVWPISWALTITVNMALFVWASRTWWSQPVR